MSSANESRHYRLKDNTGVQGASVIHAALDHLSEGRAEAAERLLNEHVPQHIDSAEAWLILGAAKERLGAHNDARDCYFTALAKGNDPNFSTRDAQLRLQPLFAQATRLIEQARRELVESSLQRVRDRFGSHDLRRVEKAFAIYLGDTNADYPDERQRPVFLYFPDIRVQPYYEAQEFDWVALLEDNAETIRQELLAVVSQEQNIELFFARDRSPYKRLVADWDAFFFFRYGYRYDPNHALCPKTSAILDQLPLCHIPNHSPETFFSILAPRGRIKPHRGSTNTRLVAHLPLLIPGPCSLTVGGMEHLWQQDKVVVFDDTFIHDARNDADERRVVLLMDVWHPDLTEIERLALADVISALSHFGISPGGQEKGDSRAGDERPERSG